MKYIFEGSQDLCIVKLCVQFVSMFLKVTFHPLTHPPSPQNFFSPEIFRSRDLRTINDKMKLGFRNDPLPQIFSIFLTASLSFYIKQTSLTLSASDDKVKISGSSLVAGNKLINDDANDLSFIENEILKIKEYIINKRMTKIMLKSVRKSLKL